MVSSGTPPFLDTARLHLEAHRVPGAGAWLIAKPSCVDSTFLPPSSEWLSNAVFVCHCGTTTRRVVCVERCWTVGVITPSPVAAVEGDKKEGSTWGWVPPGSGGLGGRRRPGFSSSGETPRPRSRPHGGPRCGAKPHLHLPLVAALPISGFSGAFLASLKPGISRFFVAPLLSPLLGLSF